MAFDYPTNFSNGTAVDSLGNVIIYANYVCGGWLSYGFLLIIFLMSFVVGVFISSRKALLSASFITLIFSIYFLRLDLVNPVIVFILIVGMIAGALGTKSETTI